jgi:hypothetical protein
VQADIAHELRRAAEEFRTSCTTLRGAPPAAPSSSPGTATA